MAFSFSRGPRKQTFGVQRCGWVSHLYEGNGYLPAGSKWRDNNVGLQLASQLLKLEFRKDWQKTISRVWQIISDRIAKDSKCTASGDMLCQRQGPDRERIGP